MTKRRARRWLLNIHLYGGLLCSGYLLVYGTSSLLMNHRTDRLLGVASEREWSRPVSAPADSTAPEAAARAVAAELGLAGRVAVGGGGRNGEGGLRFTVLRPGREFRVRVDGGGTAQVTEQRMQIATILLGLHDARPAPGSLVLGSWWQYTHLTVGFLFFLGVSGVVMWVITRRSRAVGWSVLLGGSAAVVALVAWLVA